MERFRAYALLTVAALILWAGALLFSSPHSHGVAFAETIVRPSQGTSTDATLAWLTLEGVAFTFSPGATSYTASVEHAVQETIVRTSTTRHRASYVVRVNNVVRTGLFPLAVGANVITVEVTAEDGVSKQTYTVTVTRAAAPPIVPPANDPPVNFRVTGTGDDWIAVGWAVPRNRGITAYEMVVYEHNGSEFVFPDGRSRRTQGATTGGGSVDQSYGALKPDTLYKVVLIFANADKEIVIRRTLTVRTKEASRTPKAEVSFWPSSGIVRVTVGTGLRATFSFANLELDADGSDIDYVFRADVVTQGGANADACEGQGIGAARNMTTVSRNPETFTGLISTACPVGDYTLKVSLKSSANVELSSAQHAFRVEPVPSAEAALSSLALSNVPFTFSSGTTSYAVNVASQVDRTTVTATTSDDGASYVVKKGRAVVSGAVPLSVGANVITVEVTAEDGTSGQTYTVTVTRAAPPTLAWLTLEGVAFTFSPGATSYTASVEHAVQETIVRTSTTRHRASYVVRVNNVVRTGLFSLAVGANVITVEVTAEDGVSKQTYTVTVTRAAAPPIVPPANDPPVNFRVTGTGDDWIAVGWAVPRNRGITAYEMVVYEHNGSEFVFPDGRSRRTQGATTGGGSVDQSYGALKPDTLYKVVLIFANADKEIVIRRTLTVRTKEASRTPKAEVSFWPSSGIVRVTVGTGLRATFSFANLELDADGSDIDYVFRADVVTQGGANADACEGQGIGAARNMTTVSRNPETFTGLISTACPVGDYTLKVSLKSSANVELSSAQHAFRVEPVPSAEAALSSLALSNVPFTFSSGTTSYAVNVASQVDRTTVTATTSDDGASYVVKKGRAVVSGAVPLSVGANVITVEVTAEDGTSGQTYTVTVTRAAPPTLAWLTLEGVAFTFSPGATSYTASVEHAVQETIVRTSTTRHRASYVVRVNNVVRTGLFSLAVGANVITVEVTAEDGVSKQTYTVTVTRAAAPVIVPPANDPPVNFRVTGTGDDWIAVGWAVPRNRGITAYEMVVYEHNGSEFVFPDGRSRRTQGATTGGGSVDQSYGALKPDTLYKVVLIFANADKEIVIRRTLTVRTKEAPAATPMLVPVLAAAAEAGAVELSWEAVTGAVRYELWTWTSEEGWQQIGGDNLTATAFRHDGLAAGTTYFYTVRTINSAGEMSAWSEYVSATVQSGLAAPRIEVTTSADAVELSWEAVTGAVRYELWTWTSEEGWQQIGGDNLTATAFRHDGLAAGTTYFYTAHTINSTGETSAWSEYVSATVPAGQ